MYTVEAEVLKVDPSITYLPTECAYTEWEAIAQIPALYTEQEELQEARRLVAMAELNFTRVRITKSLPSGLRKVVL